MMFSDASTGPTKQCTRCRQYVPLESFWRCAAVKDGRQARCKTCHAAVKAAIRAANIAEYRARDRTAANAAYAANPEKHRAKSRAFVERNPDKARASRLNSQAKKPEKYRAMDQRKTRAYLLRRYGLSATDFDGLWTQQDGRCAICLKALVTGSATHIDHDHITGVVRGLLCGTCNRGIGCLRDSVEFLERAIAYLRSRYLLRPLAAR